MRLLVAALKMVRQYARRSVASMSNGGVWGNICLAGVVFAPADSKTGTQTTAPPPVGQRGDKPGRRMKVSAIEFRPAEAADVKVILEFIRMMAALEGRPDAATIAEKDLTDLLFGDRAIAYGFLAESGGEVIASALTLLKFSSYRGRRIFYIEDIIVAEQARGSGVGTEMMKFLAQTAVDMGCDAMEWYALKDNPGALRFYERLGAQYDTPHAILGFDEAAMKKVAGVVCE